MMWIPQGLGSFAGWYGDAVVGPHSLSMVVEATLPDTPCVWAAWHEDNLVTIALHKYASPRPALAFVPPGWKGAAVRGWLDAAGIEPVFLASDPRGAVALRRMRAALAAGSDVIIALDGPEGPRREAKAGAMWLAGVARVPVMPVGCAAFPAFRVPRWDRHLVPLPGSRVVTVFGAPLPIDDDPRSPQTLARAQRLLNALNARADAALDQTPARAIRPLQPRRA
jgi:lysophospholipid acyltransferase (LPLAT)-like uncharacterized protein